MQGQMTFNDYLKGLNMNYANKCKHCLGQYCTVMQANISSEPQCPCDDYEVQVSCEGCKYDSRHWNTKCFGCKRYAYNPNVVTTKLEDRYEK